MLLPMDMTMMNAGRVHVGIDEQHDEIVALRDAYPEELLIPFAAVDPRHERIVDKTIALVERDRFRGLKLYPPTGYHPFDRRLWPLYEYAEARGLPVMTHCSRPSSVKYRGDPTPEMRIDPVSDEPLRGTGTSFSSLSPTLMRTDLSSRNTENSESVSPTSVVLVTGRVTSTIPGTPPRMSPTRAG